MPEKKSRTSVVFSLVAVIGALLLASAALLNQQRIIDTVRSWQYEPSSEVATLRDKLGLTADGLLHFNASQPELEPATEFNQRCQQYSETNNPIIGCYINQLIFIFDVDNPKLNGIEETTAAHELLHAVYERLDPSEKEALDASLMAAYQKVKTPELEERMEYYEKTEPGEEMNELHSILGTEYADLSNVLEEHYDDYFTDRDRIVAYYEAYNAVFTSATKQLKSLESQINTLVASINARISTYNQRIKQFDADAAAFQRRNNSGGFDNQAEFDAAQGDLVARQAALEAERVSINAAIDRAKALRRQYNQVVSEYNQLSRSINSSLTPIPSLK